jgi:hypothetical protein
MLDLKGGAYICRVTTSSRALFRCATWLFRESIRVQVAVLARGGFRDRAVGGGRIGREWRPVLGVRLID